MTFRIAFRYAFSKSKGQRGTSIWIILGIAVSLAAMIIISSIVNGLQTRQLDKMRNVQSFDLIIKGDNINKQEVSNLSSVSAIYEFADDFVLLEDLSDDSYKIMKVRGIDWELLDNERFSSDVISPDYHKNSFEILVPRTVNARFTANSRLLTLTFLKKGKISKLTPYRTSFADYSYYVSDLPDFSDNTIIMGIDTLKTITGKQSYYGVYVNGKVENAVSEIKNLYPELELSTYKDYNKSLYSALMLEKTIIKVFLFFIFIIICTNLKRSTNRLMELKKNEIAILEVLGMDKKKTGSIFIIQGLIISITGILLGDAAGIVCVKNINTILKVIDKVIFAFTSRNLFLSSYPFNSSTSTYEVLIFNIFIVMISVLFTVLGIAKSRVKGESHVSG